MWMQQRHALKCMFIQQPGAGQGMALLLPSVMVATRMQIIMVDYCRFSVVMQAS